MRLFAAVRPPEPVLAHLDRALSAVGRDPSEGVRGPVRWTAAENWHLTLAFYGDVPDGVSGDLHTGLTAVAESAAPMVLHLRGAGVFAHRTLWVGAGGDLVALNRLTAATVALGTELTGRSDHRVRSRPHLTVGRSVPSTRGSRSRSRDRRGPARDPVDDLVRALSVYEGPAWEVTELTLTQSEPGAGRGGGPLYTDLSVHRLGGTRDAH